MNTARKRPNHDAPAAPDREQWTPRQALEFYAAGKHFDVVDGRTRIIDTGAIASDALKSLSPEYANLKGLTPDGTAIVEVDGATVPVREAPPACQVYAIGKIPKDLSEAIKGAKMDPRHNPLNALLGAEEPAAQTPNPKATLIQAMHQIAEIEARMTALVKGKRVRIIHKWHDQPFGRSKPNLEGKEFIAEGVWVDGNRVSVRCEGLSCAPDLEHIEFLD